MYEEITEQPILRMVLANLPSPEHGSHTIISGNTHLRTNSCTMLTGVG